MAEPEEERELSEEEQAAAQVAAKKKKRKLMVILGMAALLVLVAGGLAAWYFLASGDSAPKTPSAQKPEAIERKAIYYPLKEKFVVNYEVRGRQRFVQAEVTLMLRDNGAVKDIEIHMPRIRNELIMLFSGQVFEDLQTPEGKELLRQDALRQTRGVLEQETGKPVVEQVLFTSFVMQ